MLLIERYSRKNENKKSNTCNKGECKVVEKVFSSFLNIILQEN